jgi:hypothetical protein
MTAIGEGPRPYTAEEALARLMAGNVISSEVMGTLQYAAVHLHA